MTTTRVTAAAGAEAATTMTDRWDTLPGAEPPAPPRRRAAGRPPAAATPAGRPPPRCDAAARSPSAASTHTRLGVDAVPAPAGDAAAGSHFDHDAPTAKLPAVPKPRAAKREPIKKPGPFPVIAGSAGLFFAIAALLAFQMRAGADPALGKRKPVVVAQATPAPRKVLVRRVIVTRIVEHRPRRGDAADDAARRGSGAAPAAPSAPAPAAPAPAAARSGPAPCSRRPSDHPVLMTDHTFDCMGTHVRLLVADEATAADCRAFLARLRGRAQPLPPRQRAEPAERRTRRARSPPRRCCAPRSPPGCWPRSSPAGSSTRR